MRMSVRRLGIILFSALFVTAIIALFLIWYLSSDKYYLAHYEKSPNGKHLGIIVTNTGGGATGWCRDLIYKFPSAALIQLDAESKNEPYLVEVIDCGAKESNLSRLWSK